MSSSHSIAIRPEVTSAPVRRVAPLGRCSRCPARTGPGSSRARTWTRPCTSICFGSGSGRDVGQDDRGGRRRLARDDLESACPERRSVARICGIDRFEPRDPGPRRARRIDGARRLPGTWNALPGRDRSRRRPSTLELDLAGDARTPSGARAGLSPARCPWNRCAGARRRTNAMVSSSAKRTTCHPVGSCEDRSASRASQQVPHAVTVACPGSGRAVYPADCLMTAATMRRERSRCIGNVTRDPVGRPARGSVTIDVGGVRRVAA